MLTETPPEHLKSASDIADLEKMLEAGSTWWEEEKILIFQNKSYLFWDDVKA